MAAFRALRHRDFGFYFSGQLVSMVGTWMQTVAMGWWVYRLTGRASDLGLVIFAGTAPAVLLGPLGGLAADRVPPRTLVFLSQLAYLVQALLLTALFHRGPVALGSILALAVCNGLITAFDVPGRQVLVARIVPREDLPNAIALQSALFHGSRILGPTLAGLVLAVGHEGWCFALNALSYVASLATLAAVGGREIPAGEARGGFAELLKGFRHLWTHRPSRRQMVLLAVVVGLGMPFTTLLPAMAKDVLGVGARELGWMMGCSGTGATLGALLLASRKDPRELERSLRLASFAFPVFLGLFAQARSLPLACLLLACTSFSLTSFNTATNTLTQLMAPEGLRGRVMGGYNMLFMTAMPLGTLGAGLLGQRLGITLAFGLGALGCLLGASVFLASGLRRS